MKDADEVESQRAIEENDPEDEKFQDFEHRKVSSHRPANQRQEMGAKNDLE